MKKDLTSSFLILFILLFSVTDSFAQKMNLYTSDGQLSSGLINKVMQDSRGYIWIATENGLNQFDGTRFKVFHKEKDNEYSLPGNYVRSLHELKDGRLFVGCINGLMEYKASSDSFHEIEMVYGDRKVKPHVFDMLELSTGELWIATAGYGLFRFDSKKNMAFAMDKLTNIVGTKFISSLYEDSTHTIWIGTESNGICRFYPSSNKARNFRTPELSGNYVTSFIEEKDGSILVGTLDGGVDRYSILSEKFTPVRSNATDIPAVKSMSMHDNLVYVCTDGQGVFIVKGNGLENINMKLYFQDAAEMMKVHQLFSDNDGNLWVSIYQKGLAFVPRKRFMFTNLGKAQGGLNAIGEKCVMSVYVDKERSIWVSCDNGGVYRLDKNGNLINHYPLKATVMCFMNDSEGNLWAGTYTQGALTLGKDGVWKQVKGLSDRKIYSLAEDKAGDIYIGSLDRGLERYNRKTGAVEDCIGSLRIDHDGTSSNSLNSVNYLCYARDGRIWVAHYNGISCYNSGKKTFEKFDKAINLVTDCIGYVVYEDRDGNIWFGTSEGLHKYNIKDRDISHFTVENGLPNNVVSGICEDNEGNIWISTYHGIARLSKNEKEITSFDADDGLQGNEFTHGAFFKDDHGVMYFGGSNGVTYFHPSDIDRSKKAGVPMITEVGVYCSEDGGNGGDYKVILANCDSNSEITLSSTDNTINIFFSTLTYDNPSKIQYEYRIRQNGDNWIMTEPGQNKLTFYNLSPGRYDFEIRVSGNPNKITTLRIIVTPQWYLSWPMKLVYLLIIIAVSAIFYRHIRKRRSELEEIERRRQAERVSEAKLELFTNFSHEIRTPMTLIIDPMRRLIANCQDNSLLQKYNVIYRNASRILGLVNQLMDVRKIDKGQMMLHARQTDMVGFIKDVMKPFEIYAQENDITLSFYHDMESLDCWVDLEHFDKVLMNLLSNALKHTSSKGEVMIVLTTGIYNNQKVSGDRFFEIKVIDNGDGIPEKDIERIFELFYQSTPKTAKINSGTGIGLHLAKQIVEIHSGSISAGNRQDCTGAVFTVRIPLGNKHLSPQQMIPLPINHDRNRVDVSLLRSLDEENNTKISAKTNASIVIVEDDDEIRNYLKAQFTEHYKYVYLFSSADEAYHSIISMTPAPDVIISDVMMDGMDGITLTRKLKQNAKTNHSPVILLSAKSEPEDVKAGIECGADHYIVKPFSSELLLSTVSNLINNRHLLKVKFSGGQEQEDKVEKIEMKSADEILMTKVMDIINRNLGSSDFSVEKLADEVGISRAHLHRKLKELTNLSSRDFIRSIRMRQAARLLSENNLSIAEVAYATGFVNASHFSNVFKDFHGITPTKYAAENRPVSK